MYTVRISRVADTASGDGVMRRDIEAFNAEIMAPIGPARSWLAMQRFGGLVKRHNLGARANQIAEVEPSPMCPPANM
jgi:hypothetical protein